MRISFDHAFGIHERALSVRTARAEILATNLAHAETPGYRARDLDFRAALGVATGGGLTPAASHPRHLGVQAPGRGTGEALYRVPLQASLDGNTVDEHLERGEFLRNSLAYEASLTFLNGRIHGLLGALRGE
jgi:flagellar basal-body rod protein FlgB